MPKRVIAGQLFHRRTPQRAFFDLALCFKTVSETVAKYKQLHAGPYLGILRPWAQENFASPPPLFVRIKLCEAKTTQKTDKRQNIVFSV
jgi:hypothetical protein